MTVSTKLEIMTGTNRANQPCVRGRDFLGIIDLTREEIDLILDSAKRIKIAKFDAIQTFFAKRQILALLFEKPSLRTRVTFEAGMAQLGGDVICLEGKLGERESIADVARNLERWVDGIMARVFRHETLVKLANNAKIPVINGLSDLEHPCQALADLQTLSEHKGKLEGLKIAYVGDGNNVAHSLMLAAAKMGIHFSIACPAKYRPKEMIWQEALSCSMGSGSEITITENCAEAVIGADVIYTDAWTSMGQENEKVERSAAFADFQVNSSLLKKAKPDTLVMHNLPAHRGEEITSEVLDGPQSVVFDQAENRLHTHKALLSLIL